LMRIRTKGFFYAGFSLAFLASAVAPVYGGASASEAAVRGDFAAAVHGLLAAVSTYWSFYVLAHRRGLRWAEGAVAASAAFCALMAPSSPAFAALAVLGVAVLAAAWVCWGPVAFAVVVYGGRWAVVKVCRHRAIGRLDVPVEEFRPGLESISREHVEVFYKGGAWYVRDISKTYARLNGVVLPKGVAVPLAAPAVVSLEDAVLVYINF